MQFSVLGTSGIRISKVALGTATFGVAPRQADAGRLIGAALDVGINAIDTANAYGNLPHFDRPGVEQASQRHSAEEIIGATLKGRRDSVILSTKASEPVGPGPNDRGLSRRHLIEQLERSLRRLCTDHVDIFYAHHPDPDTPLEDTLMTLDDLVRSGKARCYGLSTYPAWQSVEALWVSDRRNLHRPACLQVRYNMAARQVETEIVPAAVRFGMSLVAFSPLGGGLLAPAAVRNRVYAGEKRWGGGAFTESQLALAERLERTAAEWGLSPAQLGLAWVLSRPAVATAVIGAETAEEVAASVTAVELLPRLTLEQSATLDDISAATVVDPVPRASPTFP
jgi:aryl-alcohol dehydrogenase-like predicted oxidoreductase